MRGKETPSPELVSGLVAFMKTLTTPKAPTRPDGTELEERGERLFTSLGCVRCHSPPNFTSERTYDVSLSDERGNMQFNPPSLVGVRDRKTLFHDGRATSLRDVLVEQRHQLKEKLSEQDLEAIVAHLQTL